MKRLIAILALSLGMVSPSLAATPVYPAATNANNTFYKTNTFMTNVYIGGPLNVSNTVKIIGTSSDLIVGGTNIVSSGGSSINAVGITNGGINCSAVYSSGTLTLETGDGDAVLSIDGSGYFYVNNAVTAPTFIAGDSVTIAATNIISGDGTYLNGVGITNKNVTIDGTLNVSNDVSIIGASSDLSVGGNSTFSGTTTFGGSQTTNISTFDTNGVLTFNQGSVNPSSGLTIYQARIYKDTSRNLIITNNSTAYLRVPTATAAVISCGTVTYTFGGNDANNPIQPGTTRAYDLGTPSAQWKAIYASNYLASGTVTATNGITSLAGVTATNFVTSAVKWIDIPMNYSFSSLGPSAPALTETYTGSAVKCLAFDNDAILYAQGQFQHNVAVTNAAFPDFIFEPHVHFSLIGATPGATTSNVTWRCEWEFADIGGTWTQGTNSITYGVAATNTHYMAELGHITNNSATPHLSSVFRCRLMRPASGGQEYSTSAEVLMDAFDLHIPVGNQNAIGSSQDSSP